MNEIITPKVYFLIEHKTNSGDPVEPDLTAASLQENASIMKTLQQEIVRLLKSWKTDPKEEYLSNVIRIKKELNDLR